ncbi:GLPGLI family protein [Flavobacterium sp. K5-23]|uniref:GLPGLI family protein n=1 Tax=Flavobacterium sp. K5-23 TaxID=2746225 RepID=UPI00200EA1FA|nr:GLPGLI family protein [Flavobacterium sp. K5-23]UQD55256.1 GLPGLI family protein [Flavobacterium sp. K5-23]
MKIKILFLTILLSTLGYGQEKNIYVEYGLIIQNEPDLFKNNSTLRSYFENAIVDCGKVSFQLIITKNGSKFLIKENLEIDSNAGSANFILATSSYSGIVYTLKDKIVSQNVLLGKNIYTEGNLKNNWVLSNETKLIDNYLCYKATNVKKVINDVKTFNHPVTAWYCPELPYPYGPNGYGNLPGLVLELQVRNVVFGAKSIKLDSELDFDIKSLEKIKILNDREIDEALDKFNEF